MMESKVSREVNEMAGIGGLFALVIWAISLAIFYLIIKTAVKNGVTEAHQDLIESVKAIERKMDPKKNAE